MVADGWVRCASWILRCYIMQQDGLEDALSTCRASLHKRRLRNVCLDSWPVKWAGGSRDDGREGGRRRGDRQDITSWEICLYLRFSFPQWLIFDILSAVCFLSELNLAHGSWTYLDVRIHWKQVTKSDFHTSRVTSCLLPTQMNTSSIFLSYLYKTQRPDLLLWLYFILWSCTAVLMFSHTSASARHTKCLQFVLHPWAPLVSLWCSWVYKVTTLVSYWP